MAVKIMRGDAYPIGVDVLIDGAVAMPDMVEDVEISIGSQLQKRMSRNEVWYLDGQWYFRLSQEETFAMDDSCEVYVRVVLPNDPDHVIGQRAGIIVVMPTGSTEVL